MNRTNTLLVLAIAGTGLLAACGGDDGSTPAVAAAPAPAVASVPPASSTTIAAAAGSTVAVKSAESDLGPILVGVDGRTLYGFTNDTPTPEQLRGHVRRGLASGRGRRQLDRRARRRQRRSSTRSTRPDGTLQLVAGKYPLYAYSGDAAPGDVNGQGSGDVWFAVEHSTARSSARRRRRPGSTDRRDPYARERDAAPDERRPAETARRPTRPAAQGRVPSAIDPSSAVALIDAERISRSTASPTTATATPTCNDACADAWPPVAGRRRQSCPAGLDASRVQRSSSVHDGTHAAEGRQVAAVPVRR